MKETLSHRQLQSLIEVSNVLNSTLDIDTVIDSIMDQTVSITEAAHGGVLFIYDKVQNVLLPRSNRRFTTALSEVRLRPGESMTGLAFNARECLIFKNRVEVEKATATLSEKNSKLMYASVPMLPYSSICSPILSNGECIGVITLDSFDPNLQFVPQDIHLLNAIAHQAAVALEKANLYQEQEQTVKVLERLNNTIIDQNKILSRSVEIHKNLATLVLKGEGLQSIISYLHEITGYQVFLFDELGENISHAYDVSWNDDKLFKLKEKVQKTMQTTEIVRSSIERTINPHYPYINLLTIGARPEIFGSLVVAASEKIDAVDLAALEHACTVISLEMVKEQAIFEAKERIDGEFINDLLAGKMDDALVQKAKQLHFDPSGNYIALILRIDEEDQLRTSISRHFIQLANHIFSHHQIKGIAVRNHDQIVMLMTFPQKVSVSYTTTQIKELVSKLQHEYVVKKWGDALSIGIGRIHPTLQKATKSLQEAAKCLQFMSSYGEINKVVSYKDLGVHQLLLQNTEDELIEFIYETLGPLIRYDQNKKGGLLPSLFAYLEHNQNVKEAAEAIHVHTNTLLYRLKRVEEILETNLSNSQQFLTINLAVSLYPFLQEKIEMG